MSDDTPVKGRRSAQITTYRLLFFEHSRLLFKWKEQVLVLPSLRRNRSCSPFLQALDEAAALYPGAKALDILPDLDEVGGYLDEEQLTRLMHVLTQLQTTYKVKGPAPTSDDLLPAFS
jgi:hypothetical protein